MADTVATQILENGRNWLVLLLNNLSDGTGESGVKKYDVATASYAYGGVAPGASSALYEVEYDCKTMMARLLWEATPNQQLLNLSGFGRLYFRKYGGIKPPGGVAATGSILLTTVAHAANASYSITLKIRKNIQAPGLIAAA